MTHRARILIAVGILIVLIAAVLGVEVFRRQRAAGPAAGGEVTLAPGSVPIHVDGQLVAGFSPEDLEQLEQVSFVDDEEGKKQEGWLLSDVLMLHVDERDLGEDTLIVVSSSSREKSAQVTWTEVEERANMVMFDLSGRGTLKLVSKLEGLDTRDDWVQDVDKIEIVNQ